QPNAFAVSGAVAASDSIVAEQARISERKQGDKVVRTLGHLAARWVPDFAERAPVLMLDIVPTGKPGAFKAIFDGKPLAKAKLDLRAQPGGRGELQPVEQGAFTAAWPWRGACGIEMEHVEAKPGGAGAGAYDRQRFVTSLSFKVAEGADGPPQPPLTVPKRN